MYTHLYTHVYTHSYDGSLVGDVAADRLFEEFHDFVDAHLSEIVDMREELTDFPSDPLIADGRHDPPKTKLLQWTPPSWPATAPLSWHR